MDIFLLASCAGPRSKRTPWRRGRPWLSSSRPTPAPARSAQRRHHPPMHRSQPRTAFTFRKTHQSRPATAIRDAFGPPHRGGGQPGVRCDVWGWLRNDERRTLTAPIQYVAGTDPLDLRGARSAAKAQRRRRVIQLRETYGWLLRRWGAVGLGGIRSPRSSRPLPYIRLILAARLRPPLLLLAPYLHTFSPIFFLPFMYLRWAFSDIFCRVRTWHAILLVLGFGFFNSTTKGEERLEALLWAIVFSRAWDLDEATVEPNSFLPAPGPIVENNAIMTIFSRDPIYLLDGTRPSSIAPTSRRFSDHAAGSSTSEETQCHFEFKTLCRRVYLYPSWTACV
ncbi:hypothetical protein C8R46DRAFT_476335 [Mycena filopes]|nr:hypothetical protein C8R46DRAFT_476335 [Mycena filopes]